METRKLTPIAEHKLADHKAITEVMQTMISHHYICLSGGIVVAAIEDEKKDVHIHVIHFFKGIHLKDHYSKNPKEKYSLLRLLKVSDHCYGLLFGVKKGNKNTPKLVKIYEDLNPVAIETIILPKEFEVFSHEPLQVLMFPQKKHYYALLLCLECWLYDSRKNQFKKINQCDGNTELLACMTITETNELVLVRKFHYRAINILEKYQINFATLEAVLKPPILKNDLLWRDIASIQSSPINPNQFILQNSQLTVLFSEGTIFGFIKAEAHFLPDGSLLKLHDKKIQLSRDFINFTEIEIKAANFLLMPDGYLIELGNSTCIIQHINCNKKSNPHFVKEAQRGIRFFPQTLLRLIEEYASPAITEFYIPAHPEIDETLRENLVNLYQNLERGIHVKPEPQNINLRRALEHFVNLIEDKSLREIIELGSQQFPNEFQNLLKMIPSLTPKQNLTRSLR